MRIQPGVRVFYLFEGEPIDCGPFENYTGWPVNFERYHYFVGEVQIVPVDV
jgi:hypothetical protein